MHKIEAQITSLASNEKLALGHVFEQIKSASQGLSLNESVVISVAGTNGKGSVVNAIEAVLKASDISYAKFTSPHLMVFNERVVINGEMVSDQALEKSLSEVKDRVASHTLNYYQIIFLVALNIIHQQSPKVVLLEVGVGGLYDAVNVIDCDVAIITSISYDHMDLLGRSLEEIAHQKLGIARVGKPLIICKESPIQALSESNVTSDIRIYKRDFDYPAHLAAPRIRKDNAAGAIECAKELAKHFEIISNVSDVIANLKVPGRLEHVQHRCDVLVDVAHNPASVQNLSEHLKSLPLANRTYAIFAARADKNPDQLKRIVEKQVDEWICLDDLEFAKQRVRIKGLFDRVEPNDRVVCFGSFITVSSFLKWIKEVKENE